MSTDDSRLDHARALIGAGQPDAAEALCRDALADDPHSGGARQLLGIALLQRGDTSGALAALRDALRVAPDDAAAHYHLAQALLASGDASQAAAALADATARAPRWAAAHSALGAVLRGLGRTHDAAAALERAVALDPRSPDALTNLGTLRQDQGRLDDAIDLHRRAVASDPARIEPHVNLGNALAARERWLDAERAYRDAVAANGSAAPAWYGLGLASHRLGRLADAVHAYRRAAELDPADVAAHTNLGIALRELGHVDDAIRSLRTARDLRPDDPHAERNLRAARARLLAPWHFPMLADAARNDAYRRAIERAVHADSTVLDIGTGSGLLAMMAARAGAARVCACEQSAALAECARDVVAANGLADRVQVIDQRSTALALGEHLARRADVVVCEIVDVGLLGEGVLPTLRHALRELATPDAAVIPARATVHAQLVEIPVLHRVHPVRDVAGFDLSAFDRFRDPHDYLDLDLGAWAHRALSAPFEVARFDFRALPDAADDRAPRRVPLTVPVTAGGRVHAVAFWFDLHLDGATTLSTAPGAGSVAWRQAVQFVDAGPTVRAGATLPVAALLGDTRIGFEVGPGNGPSATEEPGL